MSAITPEAQAAARRGITAARLHSLLTHHRRMTALARINQRIQETK